MPAEWRRGSQRWEHARLFAAFELASASGHELLNGKTILITGGTGSFGNR